MQPESVIPPVSAGKTTSSIDIEYAGPNDRGLLEATSLHEWTFDGAAYYEQTGYDIGQDYPYVAQENGHHLGLQIDIRVGRKTNGGFNVFIEEVAFRRTGSREEIFWTSRGGYELTAKFNVDHTFQEPQSSRYDDHEIPHYDVVDMNGHQYNSIEGFCYEVHTHPSDRPVRAILQEIIARDSPDEATQIAEPEKTLHTETTVKQSVQSD